MNGSYEYGYWLIAILSSLVFIIFAFSFTRPKKTRDWRAFGGFSAFIVALFTEMYGIPLTIYLLSGWLSEWYPQVNFFAHENGHLWQTLFGMDVNAHFSPIHLVSTLLIGGGMYLIVKAWRVLYQAQREERVATGGPYAYVRHPQYAGFALVLLGFLVQWPTLLTLAMFPVLVWMYARLARMEEQEARDQLGMEYDAYASQVPRFIPQPNQRYEGPSGTKNTPGSTKKEDRPGMEIQEPPL
ncbi:methyltransferase family protein [Salinibacter sp.]|uniref:methyltransferase family protein n=1 Tax=Salinibacter sp. TaxID=2065818 RepID=UPI0021E709B3|nr:isoprenylcysteine carboxylmethyltransferase family protein [Salinibacter sp.]